MRVFLKKMKTLATGHTALAKSMAYFILFCRERDGLLCRPAICIGSRGEWRGGLEL